MIAFFHLVWSFILRKLFKRLLIKTIMKKIFQWILGAFSALAPDALITVKGMIKNPKARQVFHNIFDVDKDGDIDEKDLELLLKNAKAGNKFCQFPFIKIIKNLS